MTTKIYIFCLSNDTTMSFLMTARAIQRYIVFIWIVFCDFPRHIITRHKRNTYFEKDVYRFWYPITTKYKYLDLLTYVFWCYIDNNFLATNEFAYHTFDLFGYKTTKFMGICRWLNFYIQIQKANPFEIVHWISLMYYIDLSSLNNYTYI